MATGGGNLGSVVVAVDGSEESMKALRWALDSVRLRPDGALVVLHVQPRPGIAAGLNPGPIPFGGPSKQAIEQPSSRNSIFRLDMELFVVRSDRSRPNLSDLACLMGLIRGGGGAGVHAGDRGAPAADHGGHPGARAQDLRREERKEGRDMAYPLFNFD